MLDIHPSVSDLSDRLRAVGGVVAVALGGSRARGEARPNSDWDLGVFYRGHLNTHDIRRITPTGQVFEPHDWGPVINGGAWLEIDGLHVDLIYQDLDEVECYVADANEGRFDIHRLVGYAAGIPTYNAVGALAVAVVLHGELPCPEFPAALAESAPPRWRNLAAGAMAAASSHAGRHELAPCLTQLGLAALAEAHARCAARSEWVLNEKGLLERAGLSAIHRVIDGPEKLVRRVQFVSEQLALEVHWGR